MRPLPLDLDKSVRYGVSQHVLPMGLFRKVSWRARAAELLALASETDDPELHGLWLRAAQVCTELAEAEELQAGFADAMMRAGAGVIG